MKTVIIIGGGPAGMMAAIEASKENKVILVEKNEKLGKKLYITGKGRCNITSSKYIGDFFDYIPTNSNFLYSSLYSYTNEDVMNFFESLGVELKVERGDRVFPKSDKSSEIINGLKKALNNNNVEILLNSKVTKINKEENEISWVEINNKDILKGDCFIMCTGGVSYPQTGSTGDGYIFAKQLGHNITNIAPSLVPIEVFEYYIKDLQGLSLKNIELKIENNKKVIYEEFGELLFTHFGLSGPLAIKASSVISGNQKLKAVIDLKPALSFEELDKRIQRDFSKYINKDYKNALNDLLPSKLIKTIIDLSKIDENKKVSFITREERLNLVKLIKNFTFEIKGLRPIEEAIITKGGVDIKQIDSSNMKSKKINNLYFAGEILDVDGYTGGFNLQIAMSTGHLSGEKVGEI
ncbi:MAG: NAD(P)/FAD-dependent oxidoreductase [Clostridiaceae bacterium]